jgi:hypothetical protein
MRLPPEFRYISALVTVEVVQSHLLELVVEGREGGGKVSSRDEKEDRALEQFLS